DRLPTPAYRGCGGPWRSPDRPYRWPRRECAAVRNAAPDARRGGATGGRYSATAYGSACRRSERCGRTSRAPPPFWFVPYYNVSSFVTYGFTRFDRRNDPRRNRQQQYDRSRRTSVEQQPPAPSQRHGDFGEQISLRIEFQQVETA